MNLEKFMQGRPHDKNKNIEEATMEYIEQLEEASMNRADTLNKVDELVS